MTSKRPATSPDDILAQDTPQVRELVQRLRELVVATVPNAKEIAYPVWKGLGYHHPEGGYFCGVFPQGDGVKLGFEFGVLLSDPDGVLEGTGKQVRYVVIKEGQAIPEDAIKRLLEAAVGLPHRRGVKLGLVRNLKDRP